jgi:formamidopyrimidine-DNA glycosylase
MPELPEVETIRVGLSKFIIGKKISGIKIQDIRVIQGFAPSGRPRRRITPMEVERALLGQTVQDVVRRGKYLIFPMSSGRSFLCHLRMTGQLTVGAPLPRSRFQIAFEGTGDVLNFCDARRFGELWLAEDWAKDSSIAALGPEPLLKGWDAEAWGRDLRACRAKIQSALLDQKRLAGLGNIYVAEALFLTGIRPGRRCHTLKASQIPPLLENIRRVLSEGLKRRGVSFYSYRDAEGKKGQAQKHLFVYGRAGEPCPTCRLSLRDAKIGGRGTVYCPACQK